MHATEIYMAYWMCDTIRMMCDNIKKDNVRNKDIFIKIQKNRWFDYM